MAHRDWDSIDESVLEFDNVYCAFLDILGYKNKSEDFFQNRFNLYGRIERALESTKNTIEISTFFIDFEEIDISFFSDSIIIVSPQEKNNLYNILHYSRVLSANLGFEGLFIRGGIASGKHLKTNTKTGSEFLASEALQKAYSLECKSAINPRILIEPSLLNNATTSVKELVLVENTEYIVDYASIIINKNGNNEEDVYQEMEDILNYKNNSSSDEVKNKYEWILDYYYWKVLQSKNFKITRFTKFNSGKSRGFKKLS
jgi:hypothetical protein